MKQSTILIPTFEKWKAIQLTSYNIEEFRKFLNEHGEFIADISGHLNNKNNYDELTISFYWNPYQHDNYEKITLRLYEIFMYNTDDADMYKIIKPGDIREEWYVHAD